MAARQDLFIEQLLPRGSGHEIAAQKRDNPMPRNTHSRFAEEKPSPPHEGIRTDYS
jgi:hypothetical protein